MELQALNAIRSTLEGAPNSIIFDGKIHRFSTNGDPHDTAGWYIFHDLVFCVAGKFGDWRTFVNHKYNSKEDAVLTHSERREVKELEGKIERVKNAENKKNRALAVKKAAHIMDTVSFDAPNEYILRKKIKMLGGAGVIGDILYVPFFNKDMELVNVEHIEGKIKKGLFGGERKGCFNIIGEITDDKCTIILAEGYATAVSIHMATDKPVVMCFNAGNLSDVAKIFKSHDIIIAADNDENDTGIKAARLTNRTIKLCPISGDYNDLHVLQGLEAVKNHILGNSCAEENDIPVVQDIEWRDYDVKAPFKVLGRYDGRCYYLPKDGHIYDYAPAAHNKQILISIAPPRYWRDIYPSDRGGIDVDEAVGGLLALSERKTYDPAMRRGRGAWHETNGNIIIHQGDNIFNVTTGVKTPVTDFHSEYFYNKAPAMKKRECAPLNNADASQIIEICKLLPTGNSLNAYLLAGWIVGAQICGVLKWRPHMWITGRRGSGKSYTMDYIVKPLLNGNNLHVVSSTTEAGIRQSLGADAIPVIFDEAEGTGDEERRRIKKVLELVRASSSDGGGKNLRGTANGKPMEFIMRSSFLFSSISSSVKEGSDKSRVTHIEIDKAKHGNEAMFKALKEKVLILDDDFCDGFYWRCIRNAAAIKANVEVFKEAATLFFNDGRIGDQLGTLIACAYSLTSQNLISAEKAAAWLKEQQWQNLLDDAEESNDEEGLLNSILHGFMFFDGKRCSVWDMISSAGDAYYSESDSMRKALANYGLKYQAGKLYIANNNDNLREMLKKTSIAENWAKTLQRLPNAVAGSPRQFAGQSSRCTIISLTQAQLDSMSAMSNDTDATSLV